MSKFINKVVTGVSTLALAASMFVAPVAMTAHAAAAGEVYKSTDGTVWFITSNMTKRPFTSWGAFQSYGFLSAAQIKDADASVTALSTGDFIAPQDGRIFCATATKGSDVSGECSLITGGMKAAFTSSAVFSGQGYSFSRAFYGDSSFLTKTSNIENASAQHRPGTLINNNGTIQLVVTGGLWGTPSMDVFNSWGWSFADVVPANSADLLLSQTGVISARQAGQLSPSATAETPGTGDCNVDGDAGYITLTLLSTYSAENVGEGDEEVPVLGFDVKADDGSDVGITSVKVELEQTVGTNSEDITDYIDEVVVMMDGEVVGSADADEFSEGTGSRYSKSISLDDCAVIDAGETAEFTVGITALNNLDSGDIDDDAWDAEIDQIRFEDGDGVTSTETPAADAIDQAFDFDSFASANNVEMKTALNEDDEAINQAHVIDIDDTEDTTDEEILSFTIEADGDSDLNIQELPVTITTTGETDEAVLTSNAQLWYDGDSIASDTIETNGAVVFEDIDVDIDAGEKAEFKVTVDIQDTAGAADNGDTVKAEITTVNADAIVAEDAAGDRIADGDSSGSALGEAHALYDAGVMIEFVSASTERTFTADAATEDDQGTYKITFDVTAFDGDMRIDNSSEVADANAAGQGVEFTEVDTAGTPTLSSDILESSIVDSEDTANTFEVDEGTTRRFTLTVIYTADTTPTDGSVYVRIDGINWGTATDDTNANYYEFDMGDYTTDYLFLNDM